jgi:hypothetical protein
MAQKIYKLILIKRFLEPWYQLSKEEQEDLMAQVDKIREKAGCKMVVLCKSGWSSEEWPFFGVEEFPDIEAEQKHFELLNELNWFRYIESVTVLGTEWQPA